MGYSLRGLFFSARLFRRREEYGPNCFPNDTFPKSPRLHRSNTALIGVAAEITSFKNRSWGDESAEVTAVVSFTCKVKLFTAKNMLTTNTRSSSIRKVIPLWLFSNRATCTPHTPSPSTPRPCIIPRYPLALPPPTPRLVGSAFRDLPPCLFSKTARCVLPSTRFQAIRRLDAMEELRRKTRERKLDRDKRRVEFAARLESSALVLQRCVPRIYTYFFLFVIYPVFAFPGPS